MESTPIERAIVAAGGLTELAKRMGHGVKPQHVNNWRHRGVPAERVLAMEQASGVSRYDLRPDIFGPTPRPCSSKGAK